MKRFMGLFLALMLSLTACGANATAANAESAPPAQSAETTALAAKTGSFSDVPPDADYAQAVAWRRENGIVRGYGNGLFGTNDPVSVEDMEVIMGRYLGGGPEWTGDPAKAHAATRAQVAVALYDALKDREEIPMKQITTSPGDIILYQGNKITVYYARNSWSFTRLGRIDDPSGLREALGVWDVDISFQLADVEGDSSRSDTPKQR